MGFFDLGYQAVWVVMNTKQAFAESQMDNDLKRFYSDVYNDAYVTACESYKGKYQNEPNKYPHFTREFYTYPGMYYLVYGDGPLSTSLYSSYTETHRDYVVSQLQRLCNLKVYSGKVSLREPIPILDIMKEITYPKENIWVDDGDGYPMRVLVGMWRNKEGSSLI